jgi:hypothetical protein
MLQYQFHEAQKGIYPSFSFGGDITTGSYLKKLRSICERLELMPAPAETIESGANQSDR